MTTSSGYWNRNVIAGAWLLLLTLGAAVAPGVAKAARWVDKTRDGWGCPEVCSSVNMTPVSSGTHPDGGTYYVCMAGFAEDGYRPGYNLSNWRSDRCAHGYATFEEMRSAFQCLCQ